MMHLVAYREKEIIQHELTDYVGLAQKRVVVYDMEDPRDVRKAKKVFAQTRSYSRKRSAKKETILNLTLTNEIIALNPRKVHENASKENNPPKKPRTKRKKAPKTKLPRERQELNPQDLSLLVMINSVSKPKARSVSKPKPESVSKPKARSVSKPKPQGELKEKSIEKSVEEQILDELELFVQKNTSTTKKSSKTLEVQCPFCAEVVEVTPDEIDSRDAQDIRRCENCEAFIKISTLTKNFLIFKKYGVREKRFTNKVESVRNRVYDQYGSPIYSYGIKLS